MKRLFLFLIFAGLIVSTVPAARERVYPALAPVARPVTDVVVRGVGTAADFFANSIFRWSVQRELRGIIDRLDERLVTGEPLPDPRQFPQYLRNERFGGSIDPWGTPYFLLVASDSIFVASAGPDTTRGTMDDLRASMPRTRR